MEEKLRRLMKHEGINSTRLAEILGIQASGISHIMSGRNKPSYDFLLKLLQRFPQINPDWLMLDKGPMYRDEIKNKTGRPTAEMQGLSEDRSVTLSRGSASAIDGTGLFAARADIKTERDDEDIIPVPRSTSAQQAQGTMPVGQTGPARTQFSATITPSTPGHDHGVGREQQTAAGGSYPERLHSSGGFTRSASIERIVVFYKDKTFSEYQPE